MDTAGRVPQAESRPPPRRERRWWLLAALSGSLVLAGGIPLALGAAPMAAISAPLTIPALLLTALFIVAEVLVIDLELRRQVHSISLSEVPLVLGLFFVAPPVLIVARLLGSGAALLLHSRRVSVKLFVNLASFLAETVAAIVVFRLVLDGAGGKSPTAWGAAAAAAVACDMVAALTVTLAIRFSEGRLPEGSLFAIVAGIVAALANTSLALVTVLVVWHEPAGAFLLVAVAAVVLFAYRGYASLRKRYRSLAALQGFTRVVGRSLEIDAVMESVLREARDLTRCELSELMVLANDGSGIRVVDHDDGDRTATPLTSLDSTDLLWANLVTRGEAYIAGPGIADAPLHAHLAARGIRTAMVAPLQTESSMRGMLMVANPLADLATFDDEDLALFETLANHATVSLENGRLVDELRQEAAKKEHQSLHDSLTALPNRSYFLRELRKMLTGDARGDGVTVVMLMDLDHFKEVNDTLGHHDGDIVLCDIAERLRGAVRPGDVIARLGGDEFAVLLPSVRDAAGALDRARGLHQVVCESITVGGIALAVGASIGIALAPEHGDDPTLLLQRADIAMYLAKGQGSGCELYTPAADGHSRERLALAGELKDAIDRHELVLHFQPKADLAHGTITGAEALVRWEHPERGLIFPDNFIPAAEHAGVIWAVTEYVLEAAIRERALWLGHGLALEMSVNVSARDLLDDRLLDAVATMIRTGVLPRGVLTLEITESQIMAEPARVEPMLQRLSALGVRLSIDDFGTGYSSLSSLRRLPIDEIKVDKSFTMGMGDDENDAVIVRSTVDLGQNLGLKVVAEGVEDVDAWHRLRAMGCDTAQGYFLSRPVPGEELLRWVAERDFDVPEPRRAVPAARRRLRVAT